MTLDGFITFLGLIAAALAIVSPVTRLQLSMAVGRLAAWSTLFTLAVLYFEFFDALSFGCPSFLSERCPILSKEGIVTPSQAAFLVVFVWLVILLRTLMYPRPSVRSLPTLERLVARMSEAARFADLVDIMDIYIGFVDDCANGKLPYQLRRVKLIGASEGVLLPAFLRPIAKPQPATFKTVIAKFWTALKRDYVKLLPSDSRQRQAAEGILQTLLRSAPVVDWITEHRPGFGTRLLHLSDHRVGDFSTRFLEWMIAHPTSALYDEIRDNQNLARCGYVISAHNRVLQALFEDATVAERLEVYQPVGEQCLALLLASNAPDYVRSLNLPYDSRWDDGGRWRDQTFVTIRFFDIMVRAAACQDIPWHMWLFYLHHIVERLETIYDDQTDGTVFGEYPTRAARLLYSAIDTMADWVLVAVDVDEGSHHRLPANDRVDHQNDNIPKSAALALGIAMRTIVLSERIGYRMQHVLFDVALRPIRSAHLRADHAQLRAALMSSLLAGGPAGGGPVYQDKLRDLFSEIYQPWHNELDDFRILLHQDPGD